MNQHGVILWTLGLLLSGTLAVPATLAAERDKNCVVPADGDRTCTFDCEQGDVVYAGGTGNPANDILIVAQCNGANAVCQVNNEASFVGTVANCPETRSNTRVTDDGQGSCVLESGLTASCRAAAAATPPEGCVPTEADPHSYNLVQTPDGHTYYLEERDSPLGSPVPGSGFVLGGGTWLYEETNALPGLQRGGFSLLDVPPFLTGVDPVNDETCGLGPDRLIL